MADDDVVDEGQEPEETETAEQDSFDEARARAELRKANREAANLRKRLKELESAKAKEPDVDEAKAAVEKARAEAKAEALAEVLKDRALDRVETRAAKLFADPEDARALLASQVDDFIDDGKVDGKAIDAALADLLKRKPHLGVDQRRFKGSADGGARDATKPGMITAADAKRMLAEGKHAEIEKARQEGRIDYESQRKR